MDNKDMEEIAYMRQSLEELKDKIPDNQYKERESFVNKRTKELGGDSNDYNRTNRI